MDKYPLQLNGHIGKLFFVKTFLKDKKNIAALTPTSSYVVQKILNRIDFTRDNVVVEYGPGTGVFTKTLLERLSPGSKLILIEKNPEFASILSQVRDPRMRVFHDSAENVAGILKEARAEAADYVLSGIPFSLFGESLKRKIIGDTRKALAERGRFLVYQYSAHVRRYLKETFRQVLADLEVFHIPPMFVFEAVG